MVNVPRTSVIQNVKRDHRRHESHVNSTLSGIRTNTSVDILSLFISTFRETREKSKTPKVDVFTFQMKPVYWRLSVHKTYSKLNMDISGGKTIVFDFVPYYVHSSLNVYRLYSNETESKIRT